MDSISGSALADVGGGDIAIFLSGVTASNPVVDSAVLVVNIVFAGDDVTAGNPVIDTTTAVESTPVVAPDLTTGAPVSIHSNYSSSQLIWSLQR